MSALILLVLLVGGVLYLGGGLYYLYRYRQMRRMHPRVPRLWAGLRRRFFWLAGVGALLIAGFTAAAWWTLPGQEPAWLSRTLGHPAPAVGSKAQGGGETIPPPQPVARGTVPAFREAPTTTTTTTSTTATSTSESTATTSTTLPSRPAGSSKPVVDAKGQGAWTVCAASFRREAVAQGYAQRLVQHGLPARVNQVDLGQRGTWHRVCVGSFPSLAEAKGQYKQWEKQGLISDAFLLPLR